MRICILASEATKSEILQKKTTAGIEIMWASDLKGLVAEKADVYMDLLFTSTPGHAETVSTLLPAIVFINSVTYTAASVNPSFIRLNAWTGFLQRPICEIAAASKEQEKAASRVMHFLGWEYNLVPDQPGMIAPRVIAMIINEAYFALEEQVSTKAEIDTAMKLGTNYPHGPFEWAAKLGLNHILELLDTMSKTDTRYLPSEALRKEAKHL